jgi:hypothetical protein
MKKKSMMPVIFPVAAILFILALPISAEKTIAKEKLPAAVIQAFTDAYPKAMLKACLREEEKGNIRYELESVDGKINRDIVYAADGTALEIEESGDIGPIPAAVTKAISEKYPKGKLLKIEKITRGQGISYGALIHVGKTRVEMELDIAGKEPSKDK